MRGLLSATVILWSLSAPSAPGRAIEDWSYDRLFAEADLVVIASAQGTVDSDDKPADNLFAAGLVGQRTTFAVDATIKGTSTQDPITVRHFKTKEGRFPNNGPLLVTFRTKGLSIAGGHARRYQVELGAPQYLLFLKRTDGGHYRPLSGQIDPILSVKEIYPPLPEVMNERQSSSTRPASLP